MWYFIFVQAMAGICQTTGMYRYSAMGATKKLTFIHLNDSRTIISTGWPGVVTILGRWFGKSKRGLIFGIWNSHTSIGNILGSLIAAHYVETDWSNSFIVPGFIMGLVGFGMFLFLVDSPEIVGCQECTTPHVERRSNYGRIECGSMSDGESDVDDTDIIVGEQVSAC